MNEKKRFQHWQLITLYLIAYDIFAVTVPYFAALLVRFEFRFSAIPAGYLNAWIRFAPIYAVFCIAVFTVLRLYKSIWRFASYKELERVTIASCITCLFHVAGTVLFIRRMPVSYYVMGATVQFLLVTGILADKEVDRVVAQFAKITDQVLVTSPDSPRKLGAAELAEKFRGLGIEPVGLAETAEECVPAVRRIQSGYDVILFAGSLYLAGTVRRMIRNGQREEEK